MEYLRMTAVSAEKRSIDKDTGQHGPVLHGLGPALTEAELQDASRVNIETGFFGMQLSFMVERQC